MLTWKNLIKKGFFLKKIVSEIKSSFEELIVSINDQLEQHEKIKKIVILKDSWSIENNILTPTLKIKRNIVDEKYKKFWFSNIRNNSFFIFNISKLEFIQPPGN